MVHQSGLYLIALGMVLIAQTPAPSSVRLIRLNADNIATHLDPSARETIVAGDVLMIADGLKVGILVAAGSTEPARQGRCILLEGPDSQLTLSAVQVQPVEGIGWEQAEAGVTADLAVVRFRRGNDKHSATLTYRLASSVPWLEIATEISNSDSDRVLELPIVDAIRVESEAKVEDVEGALIVASNAAGGPHFAYLATGQEAIAVEGEGQWHLGLVSGDPLNGILKRAGHRILSFGRAEQSFRPIEVSRDWRRSLRDRESWFRLSPGSQRVLERRLAVAGTRENLVQLAANLRQGTPSSLAPSASTPHEIVVTAPPSNPSIQASPTSYPKHSASKIVGRLRSNEPPVTPEEDAPMDEPQATLHPPVPAEVRVAPATEEAPSDLAPTIDAIESLPPPIE